MFKLLYFTILFEHSFRIYGQMLVLIWKCIALLDVKMM